MRVRYPNLGIEVVGGNDAIAIILAGANAPSLPLCRSGVGSQVSITLRIGILAKDLAAAIGSTDRSEPLFDQTAQYAVYPDLGIAVRDQHDGLAEMVVVRALEKEDEADLQRHSRGLRR